LQGGGLERFPDITLHYEFSATFELHLLFAEVHLLCAVLIITVYMYP